MSVLAIVLLAIGAVVVMALAAWRLKPGTSHGSAGFGPWPGATATKLAELPPGIVLGKTEDDQLAGWAGEGHWLVVAPTGAGKSTGVLAPSIANWQGSLLTVDIKGELAQACAPALQAAGIKCVRIDPFDVLRDHPLLPKVSIDPLRQAATAAQPVEAFKALAEILIEPPGAADAHWAESARVLVAGLAAGCSAASSAANASLQRVSKLLMEGHAGIRQLERVNWPEPVAPVVEPALKLLRDAGANERGAILSTARRQLGFLDTQVVAESLAGTWQVDSLVTGAQPVALFIILPPEYLGTQGRFLRIVVGSVVQALLAAGTSQTRRLLMVLDEAAALGRLEAVERGVSLFRGFGAHFLLAFQDWPQLTTAYGVAAASIQANCHSLCWACRDLATCEMVSAALGEETVLARSRDLGSLPVDRAGASGMREVGRHLLTPDEVRRLSPTTMLAMPAGARPVRLSLLAPADDKLAGTIVYRRS